MQCHSLSRESTRLTQYHRFRMVGEHQGMHARSHTGLSKKLRIQASHAEHEAPDLACVPC